MQTLIGDHQLYVHRSTLGNIDMIMNVFPFVKVHSN